MKKEKQTGRRCFSSYPEKAGNRLLLARLLSKKAASGSAQPSEVFLIAEDDHRVDPSFLRRLPEARGREAERCLQSDTSVSFTSRRDLSVGALQILKLVYFFVRKTVNYFSKVSASADTCARAALPCGQVLSDVPENWGTPNSPGHSSHLKSCRFCKSALI